MTDVLSGSFPGEIYLFRRLTVGSFAKGETLKLASGDPANVGQAAAAFAVDWDSNGALDLLIGNIHGEVHVLLSEGSANPPSLGPAQRLSLDGDIHKIGDAGPIAADWDDDGRLDLLVGTSNGSVWFYRNRAPAGAPELDHAVYLVPRSPAQWQNDDALNPGEWGLRVKPCVVDFNDDGKLDLLLGDLCGGRLAKPAQTADEIAEESRAAARLPLLRSEWAATMRDYRARLKSQPNVAAGGLPSETQAIVERLDRLRIEQVEAQATILRYQPQSENHGYVWYFQRK